jgi:hypothetical protein
MHLPSAQKSILKLKSIKNWLIYVVPTGGCCIYSAKRPSKVSRGRESPGVKGGFLTYQSH